MTKKGCISLEEDDYHFGPWLHAVGPKVNWGRNLYNKSKTWEAEDDTSQESDGEDIDK